MAESAREIDLDPRRYVGLSFPLRADNNNNFALTRNSFQQAQHNLKNLLLTHIGERVAQPLFGSRLRALCFEQDDNELPERIETEIRRATKQWLSYISIEDVQVLTDAVDRNKIVVKLTFSTSLNPEAMGAVELNVGTTPT